MDPKTVLVRTEGLMSAPVDADLVILNPGHDDYVGLNEVGHRIWELLEVPTSVEDLCRQLSEEFEASPERISSDINAFIEQMRDEDLVNVVDQAAT